MINKKVTYDANMNNPEKFGSELSKIKKENNFQVPENYFDDLTQMIKEKVNQKEVRFSFESMFLYFLKPYRVIALGSMFALLILGLFIITIFVSDLSSLFSLFVSLTISTSCRYSPLRYLTRRLYFCNRSST